MRRVVASHERKTRVALWPPRVPGCFRLRWMASSSAEASSYAQGFGVTRRRDQQDGATSWGKEIRGRRTDVSPEIIGGVRWQQDGRETLEILSGRFQGLLPNDLSQGRIHCLRSREYFGDIGLQDHDVRPFRVTTRVFSAYRLREIVIAFHRSLFGSTGFLFHKISVPASSLKYQFIICL